MRILRIIKLLYRRYFNNRHKHIWRLQREVSAKDAGRPEWNPSIELYDCDCGASLTKRGDFVHFQKPNAWK